MQYLTQAAVKLPSAGEDARNTRCNLSVTVLVVLCYIAAGCQHVHAAGKVLWSGNSESGVHHVEPVADHFPYGRVQQRAWFPPELAGCIVNRRHTTSS